jgi:tRNA(fMet)-specific endonuclease VapC
MAKYILDTDHVSLILRGDQQLQAKVDLELEVYTTVITFQENFNGWVTRINQAKPKDDFVELYSRLERTIEYFKKADILGFDPAANQTFRQLLQQNLHLRKVRLERDLRIAAIALTHNAIVITRNQRDFSQVPGLQIVDWSSSES